jgi:hypothetical protein
MVCGGWRILLRKCRFGQGTGEESIDSKRFALFFGQAAGGHHHHHHRDLLLAETTAAARLCVKNWRTSLKSLHLFEARYGLYWNSRRRAGVAAERLVGEHSGINLP